MGHLRILLLDAIERIEIAIRTKLANYLSLRYKSAFAHLKPEIFHPEFSYEDWVTKLDALFSRSDEDFVKHFKKKYHQAQHPAIWMSFQLLTFGDISYFYQRGMRKTDRQAIAKSFGVDHTVFASWLHALVVLRNYCAHHARVWNRNFPVCPKIPKGKDYFVELGHPGGNVKIKYHLKIISYLMESISTETDWPERLGKHIGNLALPVSHMGF